MKSFFKKTTDFFRARKKASIAILIIILIVGYFAYRSFASTGASPSYVLGSVEKGTIVSSITGSGQVTASRTLDLKPLASGNVVYVGVREGEIVQKGALIAELDATAAEKAVRDAEANLKSAQLSLQKMQQPSDSLSILQAQNALTEANAALTKAYDDGFNTVSSTFLDIPTIITGLDTILHGSDASGVNNGQNNIAYYRDASSQFEGPGTYGKAGTYADDAEKKYEDAKKAYDANFADFKTLRRSSSTDTVQKVIDETYATTQLIADATQSLQNLIQYYQDVTTAKGRTPIAKSDSHLTTLSGYTSKVNSDVSGLAATKNTITSNISSVPEKEASLKKLQDGADPLDVESSELSVTKSQNALADANDNLENYYVRAPFGGTIAKINVKTGDPASSGTTVATLIGNEQMVDIPLNEVDVAKVKIGQKVTLTFDAIDGLTLTGKVASIDAVGTVTQGVVNYTVTISFDSSDPRVKPGMSTTASIITQVAQDVLVVPSSAVKNSAAGAYVQTPSEIITEAPIQTPVTTGISDDTKTEIVSGLTEGQQIITKTINAAAKSSASSAPSLLGGGAGNRGSNTAALRGVTR